MASRRARGFTLIEMLLALGLLITLMSIGVFAFSGWQRTARLNEGAERFESLLRASRAEAAIRGRRLRLTFVDGDDGDTGVCVLQWEADPIGEPGVFTPFTAGKWDSFLPGELVRIGRCRLTGPDAYRTMPTGYDAVDGETLQTVTFYPDGSSDSAEVVLLSTDEHDTRGAVVRLNGLTGIIDRESLTEEQLDELLAESL